MTGARFWVCFGAAMLVLAAMATWFVSGARSTAAEPEAKKPPPLKVDKGAPLLLDEPTAPVKKNPKAADNEACHVCHGNYREDAFVKAHADDGTGCVKCHGASLAHAGDEDNITPPDKMYAADEIAKSCQVCHETHDAPAAKVIACWQEKCPARTDPKQMLCTDCHEHRLKFRTVWWDKKTGKLGDRQPGEKFRPNVDLKKVPGKDTPPVVAPEDEMK